MFLALAGSGVRRKGGRLNRNAHAAVWATIITALPALIICFAFPKALFLLIYIPMMLPLWYIDDLGVIDIGRPVNGFFVPNSIGYAIAASALWLVLFAFIRVRGRARSDRQTS